MWRWIVAAGVLHLVALPALADEGADRSDPIEQRLQELERRNREILERLRESERRNEDLARRLEAVAPEPPSELDAALHDFLGKLDGEIPAPRISRSGTPIRFYGFLRTDAYAGTGRMQSDIVPFWALSEDGSTVEEDDGFFALDVRLTRLGIEIEGGRIGDANVEGRFETDFANFVSGGAESRPFFRIRVAYVDLDFGRFSLRAGQDWDLISPLYPSVNAEGVMWNSGNLGDRRPQVRLAYRDGGTEGTEWTAAAAAGLTGAIDNQDLDGNGARDGFDFGAPGLHGRIGLKTGSWVEGERLSAGLWGHVAGMEVDTPVGGEDGFTAWSIGADLELPLVSSLVFRAEAWMGKALADMRGGIGQSINVATGEEIESRGGWVELVFRAAPTLTFALGASLDDPEDGDVPAGGRTRNQAFWAHAKKDWGGGLVTGLDVVAWDTEWSGSDDGDLVRLDLYLVLSF